MHIFSIILILDQLTGFNNLQKRFTVYIQHNPPPLESSAILFSLAIYVSQLFCRAQFT